MKFLNALLVLILAGLWATVAQAQIGTSCLGCMPRTGQVYDSTKTTPAPSFTTSASTGEVYIPPREVIVTVPIPTPSPPIGNDPYSFSAVFLNCNIPSGSGEAAIGNAISELGYKAGGRCADDQYTWWQAQFSTYLHSVYDSTYGTGYVTSGVSQGEVNTHYYQWSGSASLASTVTSPADQSGMSAKCVAQAQSAGYLSPSSYNYYRGPSSATCSK